jgi:ribosomal protein S18 acetylase RimI-like enzyme
MTPIRNGGVTAAILSWVPVPGRTPPLIRPYRYDDLCACRELWAELTQWHRELYGDPEIGGSNPGVAFDPYLSEAAEDGVFVAEIAGAVVGLAGLIVRGDGKAELEPVVVAERFRGEGIGGELTEAVVAAARARGIRRLTVRPVGRNEAALRFFHGSGFDVLGRVELQLELGPERIDRRPGPELAERRFRV